MGPCSTWSQEADLEVEVIRSEDWPDVVGTSWIDFLDFAPSARLCLPTGSTPRPMYRRFVELGGDLSESSIFLLDEFGLPPGSEARCDAMIRRDLLDRLPEAPSAVETWNTEAPDLRAECARFAASVQRPGLDLTMLGIGRNGHLGLNEPGSLQDSSSRWVDLDEVTVEAAGAYGEGPSPTWGLTLGIREILGSDQIWLLATGSHKAEILRAALLGDVTPTVPASYLQRHRRVTVFTDEPAASLL